MTAFTTWAGRVIVALFTFAGARWIALAAREGWQRAGRVIDDARKETAPAADFAADFAFLANCLWCADLSEEPLDCVCTEGCTEVEWCVARYEHTNTSIGTIPVYREDS